MMSKTVLINCSPKKSLSVSGFIHRCFRLMLTGNKVCVQLRSGKDHETILNELLTADKVVFAIPLYVDSVPSHVLPFLKKMEAFCLEHSLKLHVYVIGNNGFIEGKQNEPMMQVMENFCERAHQTWCGGMGIGGGVMLNVTRIMLSVMFGLTLLEMILSGIQGSNVLAPLSSFAMGLLENIALCSAIIVYALRLAFHVNKGTDAGKKYTRILLPSFVFIIFADIFFVIISVFQGGIFRGWFKRFKPTAECGIMVTRNH